LAFLPNFFKVSVLFVIVPPVEPPKPASTPKSFPLLLPPCVLPPTVSLSFPSLSPLFPNFGPYLFHFFLNADFIFLFPFNTPAVPSFFPFWLSLMFSVLSGPVFCLNQPRPCLPYRSSFRSGGCSFPFYRSLVTRPTLLALGFHDRFLCHFPDFQPSLGPPASPPGNSCLCFLPPFFFPLPSIQFSPGGGFLPSVRQVPRVPDLLFGSKAAAGFPYTRLVFGFSMIWVFSESNRAFF